MFRTPAPALILFLIVAGGVAWPMGHKMDIFVPADALVAEKRYAEAIDLLQGLLVSSPKNTSAIKDRIAKTELLEADDEIASQHYNEALAALSLFWAQFPEKADQAQKKIRTIYQLRGAYNAKAKDLLSYMSDPKNRVLPNYNQEVAKRIDELDKLDFNNPDSKKTITTIKETSTALVYQDSMKAVMSAGRVLIDARKYAEAAKEYLKGFDLFKLEFENAGYDEVTTQAVAKEVAQASSLPATYEASQADLVKSVEALSAAFASGQPETVGVALPAAQKALEGLRSLRDSVYSSGAFFTKTYGTISNEGRSPIEYQYLAYLDIFLRGRPDSYGADKKPEAEKGKPEGIGGAFLAQTGALLAELEKSAQASVDSAYAKAERDYDGASYLEASSDFSRTAELVGFAAQVLALWSQIPKAEFVPDLANLRAEIDSGAAALTRVQQLGSLAVAGGRLSDLVARYEQTASDTRDFIARLDPSAPIAETRTALDRLRDSVLDTEASLEAEEAGKAALSQAAAAAAKSVGDDKPTVALAAYSKRLDAAVAEAKTVEFAIAGGRLSDLVARYGKIRAQAAEYLSRLDPALALSDARTALDGLRSAAKGVEALIQAEEGGKSALSDSALALAKSTGDDRPTAAYASYSTKLDQAAAEARALEFSIAASRGKVEGDYIERELAARTAALNAAASLIDGQVSERADRARAGYSDPSPSSAIKALSLETTWESSLSLWISGDLSSMGAEEAALVADPAFAAARTRIEGLRDRAAALQARRAEALARATEKKQAADEALAAAGKDFAVAKARLAEAKALIAQTASKGTKTGAIKKDFADSSDSLGGGLKGVVESSTLDFDPKAWDDYQQLYSDLSGDLDQTRKNYFINEAFRGLGDGQNYYLQGLYDLAAESLTSAQESWHEVNDADQEQVKYWQNLVKQASDTNNKRDVPESNPMYYDVSGYLSEARKLYQQGDAFIRAGQKTDANAAFDAARQNLNFVTTPFPLNEEAGFLLLQIEKSFDPSGYKLNLPRKIADARTLLTSDPTTGYSRIADLFKMEPDNKDLRALLVQAEIAVGKRRAPPTKQDLANAAALVADAVKLLKTGRQSDAAMAESRLNQALTYEPTNKQAQSMLRDIQTLNSKAAGPALGLTDQAILDKATSFFAAGQYNQARDTLDQLLSDPNKRTKEVLKLDNDMKTKGY